MAFPQDKRPGGFTVKKIVLLAIGWMLLVIGPIIGLLPGPGGFPITAAGLILLLSQSYMAKRIFLRWCQRHPRLLGPLRRFIQRKQARSPSSGKAAER